MSDKPIDHDADHAWRVSVVASTLQNAVDAARCAGLRVDVTIEELETIGSLSDNRKIRVRARTYKELRR